MMSLFRIPLQNFIFSPISQRQKNIAVSNPYSCRAVYNGVKDRPTKSSPNQHQSCLKARLLTHWTVAKHQYRTGHEIPFDNISVLTKSSFYFLCKCEKHLSSPSVLLDDHYYHPFIEWLTAIRKLWFSAGLPQSSLSWLSDSAFW